MMLNRFSVFCHNDFEQFQKMLYMTIGINILYQNSAKTFVKQVLLVCH